MKNYKEIESEIELKEVLEQEEVLENKAFQNLDFNVVETLAMQRIFVDCLFLGCQIPNSLNSQIADSCLIFPNIPMPFNPFLNKLYERETMFNDYELGKPETYLTTLDNVIYQHYLTYGKNSTDIKQALAMRLHDHSITDALNDFLENYDERKTVAMMGGHNLSRADMSYLEVCRISKKLTENGYLMISGGGPGAMEATHVGAWFAGKPETDLEKAVSKLAEAPKYTHPLWLDKAFEVLNEFPNCEHESLGVPTWLYGHEPPTPFATKIAKYFDNSVREDGLVTIAKGGIVFAPGSAGTIQEIFQDATQNHYLSFGYASPMVFLNRQYWTEERPIYPLLKKMSDEGKYQNLILSICDASEEVVEELEKFSQEKNLVLR